MLVLDQPNTYMFSNAVVRITDNTVISEETNATPDKVPAFNVLIPTVQDIGVTNVMELFHPGQIAEYVAAHGTPNAHKFGFGPDTIYGVLEKFEPNSTVGVGVYTVNLRGPSATAANVACKCLWRVEPNVPYVDTDGNPYYMTADGDLTIEPAGNTPVVRDVLHLKFVNESIPDVRKWTDVHAYLNSLYSEVEDDAGYKCIPWFAVMYRGCTEFGNNAYFSMKSKRAEWDGNMYYSVSLFDGIKSVDTDYTVSMDPEAGAKYNTSYYVENQFNDKYVNFRFMAAEHSIALEDLINKYLYTVDDYLNGNMNNPSMNFSQVDVFKLNTFGIQLDMGSIDCAMPKAFSLTGGTNGNETRDELFKMFFSGEIIPDINSVIRYHINYIPDMGYDDDTKRALIELVKKRIYTTTATIMVGGTETLSSALIDHQGNYYENMPRIRQLAKAQSPMRYNPFVRRTMSYPATYYDTMALMDHFIRWSNYYTPFAGAQARWTGFIDDTMQYPAESAEIINSFYKNRVNLVMKDRDAGAYLVEQSMNTILESDQTEFSNSLIIGNMLYDLIDLVHQNHFKFNEAEEVRIFNEAVNDLINSKYEQFAAEMSCNVYRAGTVGRNRSKNKIEVRIDLKDINKYTDIDLILEDN